jgi:hypothetical protein
MSPPGKSVVTAIIEADYDHWMDLRSDDRQRYNAEKTIDLVFEKAWPGIRERVEVIDVATPATYDRYTGNWKGSFEGWLLSPHNAEIAGMAGMPRTLPGLSNFVMAAQWVWPGGGLPSGLLTGRWAVQSVCAADGRSSSRRRTPDGARTQRGSRGRSTRTLLGHPSEAYSALGSSASGSRERCLGPKRTAAQTVIAKSRGLAVM